MGSILNYLIIINILPERVDDPFGVGTSGPISLIFT